MAQEICLLVRTFKAFHFLFNEHDPVIWAMQQIGPPPNCIDHDTIPLSELAISQTMIGVMHCPNFCFYFPKVFIWVYVLCYMLIGSIAVDCIGSKATKMALEFKSMIN